MPIIVFASPKGGAGKTTSAFILATELAQRGLKIKIIDADPNHHIANWSSRGGVTNNLEISINESEDSILEDIEEASRKADFVIVDLEGTANLSVAYAISTADMVIVPCQRSTLDAGEAAKAIALVKRQSKVINKNIPVALLLTRTSPAIRSKGLKRMTESLEKNEIELFETEMNEREAFKAIFDHTCTLEQLTLKEVSGLDKAKTNAGDFAAEVVRKLKNLNKENNIDKIKKGKVA